MIPTQRHPFDGRRDEPATLPLPLRGAFPHIPAQRQGPARRPNPVLVAQMASRPRSRGRLGSGVLALLIGMGLVVAAILLLLLAAA